VTRELTVYVPPGYDQARSRRYPVLYLLHGFANDQHSWHRYGRANDILDNLLAQRAIAPFLVVMPLGYGARTSTGMVRASLRREQTAPVETRRCTSGTCWRTSSR